ncbi:hypothetical protein [Streptomyces sp. NPDC046685]|uniref:hypothetical protein n=1 Tax=Streptomyces sp. NPDC046685 TaxID=3157202 RepID=UPI0033D659D3
MTRYGFAIKALPKGGKPFEDDEDEQPDETTQETPPGDSPPEEEPAPQPPTSPSADPAAEPTPTAGEEPAPDDAAAPPVEDPAVPQEPTDDARPWSGDMYDEGDETEPDEAFAAYAGAQGEQAWLDKASDGTLTGWVRDSTGQVWRYSDPDAWAIDVDDAQMTRTHSRTENTGETDSPASDRGQQEPLFPAT